MVTCEAVKRLGKVLTDAFCAETAKSGYAWSPDNRTAGQCAVCALFVQNLLGGDICKVKAGKRTYYFNLIILSEKSRLQERRFAFVDNRSVNLQNIR